MDTEELKAEILAWPDVRKRIKIGHRVGWPHILWLAVYGWELQTIARLYERSTSTIRTRILQTLRVVCPEVYFRCNNNHFVYRPYWKCWHKAVSEHLAEIREELRADLYAAKAEDCISDAAGSPVFMVPPRFQ